MIFQIYPIGYVHRHEEDIFLEISESFRLGLKNLRYFSHVIVLWWADKFDDAESRSRLLVKPPYEKERLSGVFATRAPFRPNPIAITTCHILEVNEEGGIVRVKGLDADDGTPVIDLKAYFPTSDRVKEVHIPPWLVGWPEWIEE